MLLNLKKIGVLIVNPLKDRIKYIIIIFLVKNHLFLMIRQEVLKNRIKVINRYCLMIRQEVPKKLGNFCLIMILYVKHLLKNRGKLYKTKQIPHFILTIN